MSERNKKFDSKNSLIQECFSPLINRKLRAIIELIPENELWCLKRILTEPLMPLEKFPDSEFIKKIYEELGKQKENFVRFATEKGML